VPRQADRASDGGVPALLRRRLLIRTTADIIALSPPLIIERPYVDRTWNDRRDDPGGARLTRSSAPVPPVVLKPARMCMMI